MTATIAATGSHVPAGRINNQQISDLIRTHSGLDLPAEALLHATGIVERTRADDNTHASHLAALAAQDLESKNPGTLADIDLLIFASASRDFVEPATAHAVADMLDITPHCFDLSNACNSLINGIDVAAAMIDTGRARNALVVSGEKPSTIVRYNPATPQALNEAFAGYTFGDAGTALHLTAATRGGLTAFSTHTESRHWAIGGVFGGGTRHPRSDDHMYFTGDGAVLRAAFEQLDLNHVVGGFLSSIDRQIGDFTRVLIHQVSVRYVDRLCEILSIQPEQLDMTVDTHGNLASVTLGLQLDRIRPTLSSGDSVLLVGLGGGISIQCAVWDVP